MPDAYGHAETLARAYTPAAGVEGHFRTATDDAGRWWLLDPNGRPFYVKGVCGVNRAGTPGGRLAKDGPYAEVVDAKYGYPNDPTAFVEATLDRLRSWGFNSLGSWATEEFFDRGMPYTEVLEYEKACPSFRKLGVKLPDVYHPDFERTAHDYAATLCPQRRDSRDLIGYFTDNEKNWKQSNIEQGVDELEPTVNPGEPTLLQWVLALPDGQPAREAAIAFLNDRHGGSDPAALSAAWGIDIPSWDELRAWTGEKQMLVGDRYLRDTDDFLLAYAERYFRITAEAIHAHDPNHLILGPRFGSPPGPAVLKAARRPWVDVISANNYRETFYERVDAYAANSDLPQLNGEFSWASDYFMWASRYDPPVSEMSVEDRVATVGPATLERAATHPQLVGYTWYRWVQRRREDPPIQYGLVDSEDRVDPFNAKHLAHINARLDAVRRGELAPATLPG